MLSFIITTVITNGEELEKLGNASREVILNGSNKYKSFLLDEEVYQYASLDLSDLRIVDATGKNIPYYIIDGYDTLIGFKITKTLPYHIKNEGQQTNISVKNEEHLKISSITVEANGTFKRDYRVVGINAEGENERVEVGNIYNLEFKKSHTRDTEIKVKRDARYSEIKISIDNKDDAPLDIKEIKIGYVRDKVVFAADGKAPYMLWYGNLVALKPSYDIERYKSYIKEQDLCSLGKVVVHKDKGDTLQGAQKGQILFNSLLVITTGVIIIVLLKRLKK